MSIHETPTIINTRPANQAVELAALLQREGFQVFNLPALEVVASAPVLEEVQTKIGMAPEEHLLVFTSANGVHFFAEFCCQFGSSKAKSIAAQYSLAVIGQKTKLAAERLGFSVVFVSEDSNSQGFGKELRAFLDSKERVPKSVILLRGNLASSELALFLRASVPDKPRWTVEEYAIYRTERREFSPEERAQLREICGKPIAPLFAFTSSEAVRVVEAELRAMGLGASTERIYSAAVIGPETAVTAREKRFKVVVQPADVSIEAMVDGLSGLFQIRPDSK